MTTYYIDYNRGNDSNNGTSSTTPWQNLSQITTVTTPGPGDQFLLASDSTWRPAHDSRIVMPVGATGTKKNPVVIGKYEPTGAIPGRKPTIIWNRNTIATDWTETASPGVWLYSNTANYLFTNSCLIRLNDTWEASCVDAQSSAAVIAAAAVPGRYYASGTSLWLYSAPGINPVTYFGKVVVSPGASGYFTLSSGRKWITIQDLHFEETGCGVLMYSGNSTEVGFICRRISGKTVSGLIAANADATGVLRAWIYDCNIKDFGALAIISSCNGDGMKQLEIFNNRIDNGIRCWAQGAVYLTCRSDGFSPKVYNNHISRCRWGTRGKDVDGCAIYAETRSDNTLIYGNYITDCYMAFQDNSGRRAVFMGNVVQRCMLGMRVTDQGAVNASDHRSYNNVFMIADSNQSRTEFGGTQGSEYPCYWMYKTASTLNVTATNNIFIKSGSSRARAVFGLPDVYATSTYNLSGNWVYGFETDCLVASTNGVPSPAPTITNAGSTDPSVNLNSDGSLVNISSNPFKTTGTYVAGVMLKNSRSRPGFTPIGAYQVGRV